MSLRILHPVSCSILFVTGRVTLYTSGFKRCSKFHPDRPIDWPQCGHGHWTYSRLIAPNGIDVPPLTPPKEITWLLLSFIKSTARRWFIDDLTRGLVHFTSSVNRHEQLTSAATTRRGHNRMGELVSTCWLHLNEPNPWARLCIGEGEG